MMRSGIPGGTDQREPPFSHNFGGKAESRSDISCFQRRERKKNLFFRHALRNHADDRCDGNAQAPKTRGAVHLLWID